MFPLEQLGPVEGQPRPLRWIVNGMYIKVNSNLPEVHTE